MNMLVYQVFNNNIVLTYIEGKEVIILGTGIGFRKKKGDLIDESKIQKKFVLEDKQQSHEIASVFGMLSKEETEIILDIINDAISRMNLKISDSIYLSLADHIHYVIERAQSNLILKCPQIHLSTRI